jgi:hypothetical protein
MKRLGLRILALVGVAGCTEPASLPPGPLGNPPDDVSAVPDGYVATPAGWYHRSCVPEIEEGARIGKGGLVTRKDGTTYQLAKCQYPRYGNGPAATVSSTAAATATYTGYVEFAYVAQTGVFYDGLTANWVVPPAPLAAYGGNQFYAAFPGLQETVGNVILQPAIQYGVTGAGGGQYWAMASWQCGDPWGNCPHTPLTRINAGDSMFGSVIASNCANGDCDWTITVRDVTTGQERVLPVTTTEAHELAVGGAVEVWNNSSCSMYPVQGVFFTNVTLYKNSIPQSPTWNEFVQSDPPPTPFCGFDVTSTPTTVNLYHNPPLVVTTVSVSPATADVRVNNVVTLTATAKDQFGNVMTGKTATWVSSATSVATVSATGSLTANVRGVDAGQDTVRQATITATIDGVSGSSTVRVLPPPALSVTIYGPTVVNGTSENCSWIAVGQGGSPPYTVEWVGVLTGTGDVIYGAPQESGDLGANLYDAYGRRTGSALYITVDRWAPPCES